MKKRKIIAAVLLVVLFTANCRLFRYLLIDDTTSATRIMMHEFYHQKNIDILFVGSSFTTYGVNVCVMDDMLGLNTFSASCAHQTIDTSYALIREAVGRYDVKQIYLEMTDVIARQEARRERTSLADIYLISDYMRFSPNKVRFLLQASTMEHYANSFLPAKRNWDKIFYPGYVQELLERKATETYRQYGYDYVSTDTACYVGKGYVACDQVVPECSMYSGWAYEPIDYNDISEDWRDTLESIMNFCKEEKVELVLFYPPFSNFVFAEDDHDAYIRIVEELTEKHGVKFYDFNLCRETYLPDSTTLFFDAAHLNGTGSSLFSSLWGDLVLGNITEEQLFYSSYSEKKAELQPQIYGLSHVEKSDENGNTMNNLRVIANSEEIECRIIITPNEGDAYWIQDFSENRFFSLPAEENGICTIVWRLKGNPEAVKTVEIPFS